MTYITATRIRFGWILVIFLFSSSCKKYLDKKPEGSLGTLSSLADLQALLDEEYIMNMSSTTSMTEHCSDNYYADELTISEYDKTGNYFWSPQAIMEPAWMQPYMQSVFYSNVVLSHLPKIGFNETNKAEYNHLLGSALFYRSFAFSYLAQLYCKTYSASASTDPGIILRLTSDVTAQSKRSTVEETYQRIIEDFESAARLLPDNPAFYFRPGKKAAYGALARVFLSMKIYDSATHYANLALQMGSELLDYNDIASITSNSPFLNQPNPEIVFYNRAQLFPLLDQPIAVIDTLLYDAYDANDLRKVAFFRLRNGQWRFKGSYGGIIGQPASVFDGITTGELYLIRAEGNARLGNGSLAMDDINTLLRYRFVTGTFTDLTAGDAEEAKNVILQERRKELLYRGLRWSDLRRFNDEGANITLTRIVGDKTYTLPPNDLRWTILIPAEEIAGSRIEQNPR